MTTRATYEDESLRTRAPRKNARRVSASVSFSQVGRGVPAEPRTSALATSHQPQATSQPPAQPALLASYVYAPFGAVTSSSGTLAAANPFRFSSEYADDLLSLVYYNYRHYNPIDGRWTSRDRAGERFAYNRYALCANHLFRNDRLGLYDDEVHYYFILGLLAEFKVKDAVSIADASVYMDHSKWSATENLFSEKGEQNRLLLHNLNELLNRQQISAFRTCVVDLFQRQSSAQAKGVLLHIIGDTFAHQTKNGKTFGPIMGHALYGSDPDKIGLEHGIGHFMQFEILLKQLYNRSEVANPGLDELLKKIYLYDVKLNNGRSVSTSDAKIIELMQEYAAQQVETNNVSKIVRSAQEIKRYSVNKGIDTTVECLLPCLRDCLKKARGE